VKLLVIEDGSDQVSALVAEAYAALAAEPPRARAG